MSHSNNIITAIDIGTTKIVTLVGRRLENNTIELLGMSKAQSKGVIRGSVMNIEEAVSSIRYTVEEVQKQVGFTIKEAYVGIAGQHITSITGRGYIMRDVMEDEITKKDTDRLLQEMYKTSIQPGEEIIHVIPQSYLVDNEPNITNPIGRFGKRLEGNYLIVIGQTMSARMIKRCVAKLGIHVKQLILEPLASSAAVLTSEEMDAGVVLVDIGGGTTDIAIYHNEIIKGTGVIPFGGNVITKDIMEGLSLLFKYAELLKIQYGSALSELAEEGKVIAIPGINGREPKEVSLKSLASIIQSRMDEIIERIEYYIEGSDIKKDKLAAGIVLTGGGAMLRNIKQLLSYQTTLDVRIGAPAIKVSNERFKEINQPMYSTSVGLLIKGFEDYVETYRPEPVVQATARQTGDNNVITGDMDDDEDTTQENAFNKAFKKVSTMLENIFNDDSDREFKNNSN